MDLKCGYGHISLYHPGNSDISEKETGGILVSCVHRNGSPGSFGDQLTVLIGYCHFGNAHFSTAAQDLAFGSEFVTHSRAARGDEY